MTTPDPVNVDEVVAEAETSINPWHFYKYIKPNLLAAVKQLQTNLKERDERLHDYEEESACCPEDQTFAETIGAFRKRVAELEKIEQAAKDMRYYVGTCKNPKSECWTCWLCKALSKQEGGG